MAWYAGWNSTASRRRPLASNSFSTGGFSLASRPCSMVSALPSTAPAAVRSSAAQPAPSRATASAKARSEVNRFTSSNTGDWLNTSWVAKGVGAAMGTSGLGD